MAVRSARVSGFDIKGSFEKGHQAAVRITMTTETDKGGKRTYRFSTAFPLQKRTD
jgi:hypothetical protein